MSDPNAEKTEPEFVQVVFAIPTEKEFTYRVPPDLSAAVGVRVKAPFAGRSSTGVVVGSSDTRPEGDFEIKSVEKVVDEAPVYNAELLELGRWMSGMYLCSLGEALAAMGPGARRETRIADDFSEEPAVPAPHELSSAQAGALESVFSAPEGIFYLHGVTGSGKTEVFLRAAERVIAGGGSVLYLVPEIALTHQLVELLRTRFGSQSAVIHSRLTPARKLSEWKRIACGEARLTVGARSAVFAPAIRLGLIIIDEEHETSYKSGSTPRYHARQVAMKRRKDNAARMIFGSATPSVEAVHLMRSKTIVRLSLPDRISGGALPKIETIDMRGQDVPISGPLAKRMREVADEGKQTILFLNRRGFSYFFHCRSCGYQMRCTQCSVTLTFHKQRNHMLCHYCGYSAEPIDACPDCGSLDVGYSGFGTELVEERVRKLFPDLRVSRVDTDAIRKKNSLEGILNAFRSGDTDVLLGTQMVAKGLNFPGVKLVGIVMADTGLHLPDFRAEERTFSLIVQVSGRAGRFHPDGEVLIQTYQAENDAIRMAARGDMDAFYDREISMRESLSFPPFSRLIRIVFRSKSDANARSEADRYAADLAAAMAGTGDVLGPAECPLAVIAGNHRHQIILRLKDFSRGHGVLSRYRRSVGSQRTVYVEIDVDPVSLL